MTLATLAEALDWAEKHWESRNPPVKLVDGRQTEGELGGLAFTPAFARHLDAHPNQTILEDRSVACYHPTLPKGQDPHECHECFGTGTKQHRTLRYRWPMWRACAKLQNALRPRNQPHPYHLVLLLAAHGWDARRAAGHMPWDYAEAAFLRALRQLHGRYEEGPVDTRTYGPGGWISLSESQQNAIQSGETAA